MTDTNTTMVPNPDLRAQPRAGFLMASITRRGDALLVDARLLHEWLEIPTRFNDWITRRLADALAVEGEDYYSAVSKTGASGRPPVEFQLTLDLAKELAMLERSARGREVRRYFIQAEKELRAQGTALPQSLPDALRLAADLAEERDRAQAQVQELAPKGAAYDQLMAADGTYSVGDAAKILKTGELRLFGLLRGRGILMDKARSGAEHHNVPYQQFIDRGYFRVITRPRPGGEQGRISYTTRVTAKGLAWLQRGMQNLQLAAVGT